MSESKKIAVIGATGAQGGGLAAKILDQESSFSLRAITRNGSSNRAQALAARGAEVVIADLDDGDSLARAFEGCHGAYCVTNFWEHFSPEREKRQARNLAEAAATCGLEHVIWSTLEDTRRWVPLEDDRMPTLMERYKVPHLDAKGESNAFFLEAGVPTTFLQTSFYWDNLLHIAEWTDSSCQSRQDAASSQLGRGTGTDFRGAATASQPRRPEPIFLEIRSIPGNGTLTLPGPGVVEALPPLPRRIFSAAGSCFRI